MASKKARGLVTGMDQDWQSECDMRTLAEAEEIKKDPKRLAAARKKAQEKLDELKTVATTTPTAQA